MKNKTVDTSKLKKKMFLLFPLTVVILGLFFFLPAGSFNYWQAWLFMATLLIPFAFVASYLLKNDPELAERRMRFKEKELAQKKIIDFSKFFFFIGILIPGFDYRYGWSSVPIWLVILSNIFILIGYFIVFLVFKENKYTSRIVEVEKDQKVISTGPYSVIRHPMYAGVILMCIFMPIALGSYWALIPFFPAAAIIIPRILNEEKVLLKNLKGYEDYTKKVKYRLIPGIW